MSGVAWLVLSGPQYRTSVCLISSGLVYCSAEGGPVATVQAIIERVRGGDVDAYAGIVERYQQEIHGIVAYALADRATTEDLVQQAFVNAYTHLDSYDTGRDFGAWLRTIARNLLRNQLRQSQRQRHRLRRYHAYLERRLDNLDAANALEEELRHDLKRCRDALDDDASRALNMRYEEGLGFEEMAEMLGKTVAATRQFLSRIRISLRRCVAQGRAL